MSESVRGDFCKSLLNFCQKKERDLKVLSVWRSRLQSNVSDSTRTAYIPAWCTSETISMFSRGCHDTSFLFPWLQNFLSESGTICDVMLETVACLDGRGIVSRYLLYPLVQLELGCLS